MTTQHLPDLICADCGSDEIYTNGDSDCCIECGSHDYTDITEDTEPDSAEPLRNLFASWVPIFGGAQ